MKYDENKNIQLIADLQSKDKAKSRKAFDEIYKMYSKLILKICNYEMNSSYLAEDIFQSTFVKFYEHSMENKEIKNIKYLLVSIARNLCQNERLRKKESSMDAVEYEIEDKNYKDNETIDLVDNAVAKLEKIYRDPLVLKEFAGLSYKEICEILQITEAQLTMRLFRAKKALAKILEPILKDHTER